MASNTYLQWLQSPTTSALASDASLHYITTTTTISEPTAILKHLTAQGKQVVKKEEKVLHAIEGDNAACIETSTTLQFRLGGGTYLPSMDANLLDERTVTFPLTHIVTLDSEQKIKQVRLYWDQATLLKQVEAIGKTGRNWPIREGKTQADLVASSVKASGASAPAAPVAKKTQPAAAPASDLPIRTGHSQRDSVSVTRDPHASLALFTERDPNEDVEHSYEGPRHAVRASAKPPPREYNELFATENRPPTADSVTSPLKGGAGKNFTDIRLFDQEEAVPEPPSPERKRTYGKKYEHFAFGDGEDAPQPAQSAAAKNKSKSAATFSFEDFATPEKLIPKARRDDERHWGAGVDDEDPTGSPPKRPIVHAPRPDAASHFELTDASPLPKQEQKSKSLQRQKGMGIYHDPVVEDERVAQESHPLPSASTTVDTARRGKDFTAQYTMTDSSPAASGGRTAAPASRRPNARFDMDAHWSFESPQPERKIYKTAGDGMGSRSGGRSWGIGDDSDPEIDTSAKAAPRAKGTAKDADDLDF